MLLIKALSLSGVLTGESLYTRYQVRGQGMCVGLPNTITQTKEENLKELMVKARILIDRALEVASNYEGVVGM